MTSKIISGQLTNQLLSCKGLKFTQVGSLHKIQGYKDYNHLISINSIFSNAPKGEPIDRTGFITTPLKRYCRRWTTPKKSLSLEEAMAQRVKEIESRGKKINVMWSGGIDSTAMVDAFIANIKDKQQLRVLYSPYSVYEHEDHLTFMKNHNIEMVDISGTVYLDTFFDGVFFTGDGGDECHASLDESFHEKYGPESLVMPWQDFFWQHIPNDDFIEFCAGYFDRSGIEIQSVLDARWWFYINSKLYFVLSSKLPFWSDYPEFNADMVQAFYDCDSYESYIAHNLQDLMPSQDYASWKQNLKNYCFKIDNNSVWHRTKAKFGSSQLHFYMEKKLALKNLNSIFLLEDGQRITTPNSPLLSKKEFDRYIGNSIDYLWNDFDKV